MPVTSFFAVLAVIPLIGGAMGIVTRACTGCQAGPPLCSTAVTALSGGRVCSLGVGVEALKVRFDKALLPLSVCSVRREVRGGALRPAWSQHPTHCLCRHPRSCPEAGQGCAPLSVVFVADLVLGCSVELAGAGAGAQRLQELNCWCCRLGPGSPGTCRPPIWLQTVVGGGWNVTVTQHVSQHKRGPSSYSFKNSPCHPQPARRA